MVGTRRFTRQGKTELGRAALGAVTPEVNRRGRPSSRSGSPPLLDITVPREGKCRLAIS